VSRFNTHFRPFQPYVFLTSCAGLSFIRETTFYKMSFDPRIKKYAAIRNRLDHEVLLPSLRSSVERQHRCSCVCLTTCLFVCFLVFHGSVNCCHKVEVLSVSFTARDHSPVAGLLYCFVCVVWLIAFLLLVSLTPFSFASFQQIKRKRKKITVSFWGCLSIYLFSSETAPTRRRR
jgi:hypothetical protein